MDETTFDAYYAESFGRLVNQVAAMCGNQTEAKDCVQEAFIRGWDRRRNLRDNPDAWIRTVAYRLAVSRWRRHRMDDRAADRSLHRDSPGPNPDRVAINQALRRLPADQRRAIVLFHMADLSVTDIAAELGVPVGTVKARLSRGRAALALLLIDALPEESHHA